MSNILKHADQIINERAEEKERQYGPFMECNQKAAEIASVITGKPLTALDVSSMEFTPDNLAKLPDDGVFVFGSNTDGEHCGGAALVALKRFGAVNGQAEGPQGQSYAIPTMEYTEVEEDFSNRRLYQKVRVSPSELERSCGSFILYARSHPELRFYVTKIGCGIAGWNVEEVAEIFASVLGSFLIPDPIPYNIIWPKEFFAKFEEYGLVD